MYSSILSLIILSLSLSILSSLPRISSTPYQIYQIYHSLNPQIYSNDNTPPWSTWNTKYYTLDIQTIQKYITEGLYDKKTESYTLVAIRTDVQLTIDSIQIDAERVWESYSTGGPQRYSTWR